MELVEELGIVIERSVLKSFNVDVENLVCNLPAIESLTSRSIHGVFHGVLHGVFHGLLFSVAFGIPTFPKIQDGPSVGHFFTVLLFTNAPLRYLVTAVLHFQPDDWQATRKLALAVRDYLDQLFIQVLKEVEFLLELGSVLYLHLKH
jgi:hypothetical protein